MPEWQQNLQQFLQREPFSFAEAMAEYNYRPAAVLILLWDEGGSPSSLVTVRSTSMPTHAGEVSFPGGGLKPDEDYAAAALREAQEEIGLDPNTVQIIGRLDDAWSGAGFALAPMIGVCGGKPEVGTSEEVQRVVPFNIATELKTTERSIEKFGKTLTETMYVAGDTEIVGLSADLLGEALDALKGQLSERGKRREKYFLSHAKPR